MRRQVMFFAAVLASLVIGSHAHAQAARGHGIPDPITTAELQRYADRLMLSHDQRVALQPFHDEYVENFRLLRQGEIDRFIESVQRSGGMMPGREAYESAKRDRQKIVSRIAALDDALFASLDPMLTQEQRERLPRVRMARQRARSVPDSRPMMMQTSAPDLSELALEIGLSASELERIDPMLFSYEQKLTKLVEELPKVTNAAWERFQRGVQEIRDKIASNPEGAADQQAAMMEFMRDTFLAPQAHMVEMRALGRKTLYEVIPHLSEPAGRKLRDAFFARGYMRTAVTLNAQADRMLDKIDASEDVADEQREAVNALAAQVRPRIDAVVREAMEMADNHERVHSEMFGGGEDTEEYDRRLMELRQEIQKQSEVVMNGLAAIFPDEAARAGVLSGPARRSAGAPGVAAGGSGAGPGIPGGAAVMRNENTLIAVSTVELAEMGELLGIDDEQRAVLDELFHSYKERIAESVNVLGRDDSIMIALGRENAVEQITRALERQRDALAALTQEDERFLQDLASLFPDDEGALERIRLRRERRRVAGSLESSARWGFFSGRSAHSIDLTRIARQKGLDVTSSPDVVETLVRYERELTKLMHNYHEKAIAASEADALATAKMMAEADPQGGGVVIERRSTDDDWREQQRLHEEVARAEEPLGDLHRETAHRLYDALPRSDAETLLREYRRQAYPSVYMDPGAMEQFIMQSLRMEDLSESQRSRLVEALAEYRAKYHEMTEQLRETTERFEQAQRERRAARERGERTTFDRTIREQLQTLRHERRELNARVQINLKGILSEPQLERLGPLPELDQDWRRRHLGAPW